ncbi:MAG: hypothetical protein JWQ88_3737 [Rhodoferax sp.]|nr:hypothetical protein [Rhodoferax sp.]
MPIRTFLPTFAQVPSPTQVVLRGLPVLLAALLLGACAMQETARPARPLDDQPAAPPPAPAAMGAKAQLPPPLETHAVVVSPVNLSAAPATNIPQRPTNLSVLAYADKVRNLPPAELQQEIARLGDLTDPARQPADDLQLALALGQTRVPGDLVRAQSLLQRVLANPQEDVRMLHPLARLVSARYAEQKRVEDLVDKQNQQLRDSQRRIDQLNDRLEAMRAIERSLSSRTTPGAAPHTGGGVNGAGGAAGGGLRPPP